MKGRFACFGLAGDQISGLSTNFRYCLHNIWALQSSVGWYYW